MKTMLRVLITSVAIAMAPSLADAAPDLYVGDTAIYGGVPSDLQPNVLIILDNSGSMEDTVPGAPYDSATTYATTNNCTITTTTSSGRRGGTTTTVTTVACETNKVYVRLCSGGGRRGGGSCKWEEHIPDVASVTTSCPAGTDPKNSLLTTGQWNSNNRQLNTDGSCGATASGLYATGNWVNWNNTVGAATPKMEVASRVIRNLIESTTGVKFGMLNFRSDNEGGNFWTYDGYTTTVKDMDAIYSGTTTNREKLIAAVKDVEDDVLNDNNGTSTPLAETLFEAMTYFSGAASAFNSGTYTSPIEAECQQNYIVYVTDGMSTRDRHTVLETICDQGDCNNDGIEPTNDIDIYGTGSDFLDDVAKYMYDTDLSGAFDGTQNVKTFTVGFGDVGGDALAVDLLQRAAVLGGGEAFLSSDEQQLAAALTQILGSIFEVNSSFVAPVVPVSPENRTYSGGRVYLGFFKPKGGNAFWLGNLKKYGINDGGTVVDKNGVASNFVDNDDNGIDDVTGEALPAGASNGSFRTSAVSYWTATADGGNVDSGGVGKLLLDRDFSTNPRKLYTYTGTSTTLTDPTNAFATTNAAITTALLGVGSATARDELINFIYGYDAYDANGNGSSTDKREWILGDILHSKPLVVNYASYTFTTANEANCSVNKTLVFAGANDGMLHAFRDCDGSEAWAFIPQDVLPNLQYLTSTTHTYFVDGSPAVYRYDADNDGNIETVDGDRVIMLIGQRRGGGYYYALDVTDPDTPKYFWRLGAAESPSGTNTDYSELGQTWSDVELAKIKVGSYAKTVAIVGAGYDNFNEDGRYGATTSYPQVAPSGTGAGNVTSAANGSAVGPKGRGVYVIEIATVSDASGTPTAPNFANSGWKIWGYRYANNANMRYSFPSSVAAVDTDYNGYIDRFYVGDAGARMWAFDIGSTSTASWQARWIFSGFSGILGPGDTGRKIFYPPAVVFERGYVNLAFGTGDREHPLNTAVVDRLYSLKDKGQTTVIRETNVDELVDVTDNVLQESTDETVIQNLLDDLEDQYGWYIRLENAGEKVLAPPLTFFYSYYTTYTPDAGGGGDPCDINALGTGRLYVVNYKTGESIYNYDATNDSTSTTNTRATSKSGKILLKSDRVQTLGSGIPSGVVPIIPPDGQVELLVGVGGGLPQPPPPEGDVAISLYWRRVL
jgi:type IV pilus assembly protein PilY1